MNDEVRTEDRPGAAGSRRLPRTVSRPALLHDGGDAAFRQFVFDLLTLSARVQEARQLFADSMGVSAPQYGIIMTIAQLQQDDAASIGAVAARLHVSGPFVTAQVARLVAEGLVDKRPHAADRRSVRLYLTEAGWRRVDRAAPLIRSVNDGFFGSLDAEAFAKLRGAAARMVEDSEAALLAARARLVRAGEAEQDAGGEA